MKRLSRVLALVCAALTAGCGGARLPRTTERPQAPTASVAAAESRPDCIDFDHPEHGRYPNLTVMLSSLLEEGAAGRCFQVVGFVETGVATDEGFMQLAVLLERRESEADAWVFDWTNLRLSQVGAFANGEIVQVEVVDPGRRAILVSSSSARSRRGIVFVPNRRESSGPHDAYVPASECLVLHDAGVRPWWRTETRIEAQTGNLVVDYVGVDAEPFHQETVPWRAEEQRYTLPDHWLSRELSTRRCFFPHAAAPDAS